MFKQFLSPQLLPQSMHLYVFSFIKIDLVCLCRDMQPEQLNIRSFSCWWSSQGNRGFNGILMYPHKEKNHAKGQREEQSVSEGEVFARGGRKSAERSSKIASMFILSWEKGHQGLQRKRTSVRQRQDGGCYNEQAKTGH